MKTTPSGRSAASSPVRGSPKSGALAVGDTVWREVIDPMSNGHGTVEGARQTRRGTVVYVHPAGRYHVVEFQGLFGAFRESYAWVER